MQKGGGSMNGFQVIAIIELAVFYLAYLLKLFNQKKRGIQTSQLGKGGEHSDSIKSKRTIAVEQVLKLASFLIIPAELISILIDDINSSHIWSRSLGLVLVAIGTAFFISAMITMRDSWRAGIPELDKTELVDRGIYKISRNPAFLGFDLVYIGIYLAFSNLLLLLITVFVILAMHLQILEEEKFLSKVFGEPYDQYKKRVGRYFII